MCTQFCFPEMNTRNGTDVDAAIAVKTFSQLGFMVKVANDQTVDNMHQLMSSGNFRKLFMFLLLKMFISSVTFLFALRALQGGGGVFIKHRAGF